MMVELGSPRVLIVGAGPAGLAAAAELARCGVDDVLVIDRDDAAGGIPRFCHHPGFGLEYAHWPYSGPRFAEMMVGQLKASRIQIHSGTTLIALEHGPVCEVTGPGLGHRKLEPQVVILATGVRESNRNNLVVPGVRPPHGILTTGLLQQLVHRGVALPTFMRRLVVAGTEHVSFSAILTARHAGLRVVAMVGREDRVKSFRAAGWLARAFGTAIHLESEIAAVKGTSERVQSVLVRGKEGEHEITCDAVLFSAGWIPEVEAFAGGALAIDAATGGPVIDQAMRTSIPGVFAAGNVLRGVETSGFAALEGQRAGAMAALAIAGDIGRDQAGETRGTPSSSTVPQRWDSTLIDSMAGSHGWRPPRFRNRYERLVRGPASAGSRRQPRMPLEPGR